MDTINLGGSVWLNFPGINIQNPSHSLFVAGRYLYYLELERIAARRNKKKGRPLPSARELRMKALKRIEEKIIQREQDDLFTILSV